ncbi:MAG: hypothetical protein ACD_73C00019G0003 [uncultured bacterium]|nr:MAG: hypothetical protein ACD_73C00019G0003 [uncultured bacterium]
MAKIDKNLITQLETFTDPGLLLKELFTQFGTRAAIGTSGQLTGCVMIDMAFKAGVTPRIFTIDTLKLFPETYTLFNDLEIKYSCEIEKIKPDPNTLSQMVLEHGEHLFFDSKEKQELCCFVRKVEPNRMILKTLDVWITGLRADQSFSRTLTPRFQIIEENQTKRPILKVSPLVNWTEDELRLYTQKNHVPTHALLDYEQNGWRYESLGCAICTTPIGPYEPRRAGRWRWFNATDPSSKECGLHVKTESEEIDS